jgi:hypothetical protein
MGIYKNVSPVYGKTEDGQRGQIGLNVNGTFYEGIKKPSEIKPSTPKRSIKEQVAKKNDPNRARATNKTYKDDVMKSGAGSKVVSKLTNLNKFKR